jgi:FixJ family two-component response regulator
MSSTSTVFVIDDDQSVRRSLALLLRSGGFNAETFESAQSFLEQYDAERPGCIILDVRMPGMNGLELQRELLDGKSNLPIIFITAHGDVPMAVDAVQAGALDFIQKPFRDDVLIDRIRTALRKNAELRITTARRAETAERIAELTPREREVMDMVVDGHPNKLIARRLGVSERTVEIHRSRVMHKMRAQTLAHLVRMVATTGD